jgi:hypothetical protein
LNGFKWVSCSKYEGPVASWHRHLIARGGQELATLCGMTSTEAGLWKHNSNKKQCPKCVRLSKGLVAPKVSETKGEETNV